MKGGLCTHCRNDCGKGSGRSWDERTPRFSVIWSFCVQLSLHWHERTKQVAAGVASTVAYSPGWSIRLAHTG